MQRVYALGPGHPAAELASIKLSPPETDESAGETRRNWGQHETGPMVPSSCSLKFLPVPCSACRASCGCVNLL